MSGEDKGYFVKIEDEIGQKLGAFWASMKFFKKNFFSVTISYLRLRVILTFTGLNFRRFEKIC